MVYTVTPQMRDDATAFENLGKALPSDLVYKFTALRNLGKNGFKATSAKRLLKFGVVVPKWYIKDGKIIIGDLILTEADKETAHKLLIDKYLKKLANVIELTKRMLPWMINKFVVPKEIYKDIERCAKEFNLPRNLVILKGD